MAEGTATEVFICGKTIKLGDKLRVKYADGSGYITGEVIELWSKEKDNHLQGRLDCQWCFHDKDIIETHESA